MTVKKEGLFAEISEDLKRNFSLSETKIRLHALKLLCSPRAWALILLRLSLREWKLAKMLIYLLFHIEIGRNVLIGKSPWIPHPMDIIIANNTIIGDNCSIYQRTTFAEKGGIHSGPKVGSCCIIGAGTVIVGNITIGDNVRIGPNSVVIHNLVSNVIAYGNPIQVKHVDKRPPSDLNLSQE